MFTCAACQSDANWQSVNSAPDIQEENARRWQIEQLLREMKQLTGSEKCACCNARSQRNHLACCYHAWLSLKVEALQLGKTLYAVRRDLFTDYLRAELREPRIPAFLNALSESPVRI